MNKEGHGAWHVNFNLNKILWTLFEHFVSIDSRPTNPRSWTITWIFPAHANASADSISFAVLQTQLRQCTWHIKKSLQLDIWSRRESDSPLMMWILPKLQSLHRALMKVWWCLSLLKRRHLPHPRWRLSSYKGQNYSVSWLALLANYYLLKLSGGINTYDSCEMSQRSELMLRVQKCNKKGHAR